MIIFHHTPATYPTMVGPLREVYVSLLCCVRVGVLTSGRINPHLLHIVVLAANSVIPWLDHRAPVLGR